MLKPRVENIFQSAGWFGKSVAASEVGTMTKRGPVRVMKSAARLLFSGVRKPFTPAAKIPNQTRLIEADRAEFHTWSQVIAGFPTKLIRGKESGNDRWNNKSDRKIQLKRDRETRSSGENRVAFAAGQCCVRAKARAAGKPAACNAAILF